MIENAQAQWKSGILGISSKYLDSKDDSKDSDAYVIAAKKFINEVYGYDIGQVLFKPTMAAAHPFRPTFDGALSYFVGWDGVKPNGYTEDKGFAINEGKGWAAIKFDNDRTNCVGKDTVNAMGHYYFTSADDTKRDNAIKVEYTFGYKKVDGKLKIILQHSSLPVGH